MDRIASIVFCAVLLWPSCVSAGDIVLKHERAKDSYSLGYEFGQNLRRQQVEVDRDVLLTAIQDGIAGKDAALSADEMRDCLSGLRKKIMINQDRRVRETAAKNLLESTAFLARNKSGEGITTLPSGLQYRVIKEGSGPIPKMGDAVTVHYRGTLADGKEFDDSHARGEAPTINVGGVIKGWTEALQLMKTGSRWEIFVPPELGYGERPFGRIPPNSALIFEIELLSVTHGTGNAVAGQGQ